MKVICTPLSTRYGADSPKIFHYPTPEYNTFCVSGIDEDEVELVIYDVNENSIPFTFANPIDLSHLRAGNYILCINEYFVKILKL